MLEVHFRRNAYHRRQGISLVVVVSRTFSLVKLIRLYCYSNARVSAINYTILIYIIIDLSTTEIIGSFRIGQLVVIVYIDDIWRVISG